MIRKFTLLFLLFIAFQNVVKATEDSVTIYLPLGQDTTCFGEQLKFYAIQTAPGTAGVTFRWFHNNVLTGVTPDTFFTTAPVDGDSVYCIINFTTSLGTPDSFKSNTIIIHRALSLAPRALIALTFGSNPDCPGNPLTFTAYPIHGGTFPAYQWLINGAPVPGATNTTFTNIFSGGDVVSVKMASDLSCRAFDTAISSGITIIHTLMTASINIAATRNPICEGKLDTFSAVVGSAGVGSYVQWFVDTTYIPGAVGLEYRTDSLYNGAHVYAILHSPDACVINDTTVSNEIIMTVVPNLTPSIVVTLTAGSNPGCLDSPLTYTATYTNFGTTPPGSNWYINGVPVATNTATYTGTFNDGDLLTHRAFTTDGNCYTTDTLTTPAILMMRDTTPTTPLISLIGDLLVANFSGTYEWYYNGVLIPGAIGQTYHPSALGHYYARRVGHYCPSAVSNDIFISLLEVRDQYEADVKLYPNPTTGMLNLEFGHSADMHIEVYNVLGQAVVRTDVKGQSSHSIDLSGQPSGNYFVVTTDGTGKVSNCKVTLSK